MSVTQVRHDQHKCHTSATWTIQVWQECYTNNANETQVKNFNFDNDTSESKFSQPYVLLYNYNSILSYMASERLQGEDKFHFKNYLSTLYTRL